MMQTGGKRLRRTSLFWLAFEDLSNCFLLQTFTQVVEKINRDFSSGKTISDYIGMPKIFYRWLNEKESTSTRKIMYCLGEETDPVPGPNKGETRILYKAGYHRAVTMKSDQFRTIPGVTDISRLQRWTGGSIGRCHVCDGDAIAWQDRDDHFGVCETCYSHLYDSAGVKA
jgi:hypothetical protein